nr:hypothetical protein [Methylibium sp.]
MHALLALPHGLLVAHALRHVEHAADEVRQAAGMVAHRRDRQLVPEHAAVLAIVEHFAAEFDG